jgi:hypothetical protein
MKSIHSALGGIHKERMKRNWQQVMQKERDESRASQCWLKSGNENNNNIAAQVQSSICKFNLWVISENALASERC